MVTTILLWHQKSGKQQPKGIHKPFFSSEQGLKIGQVLVVAWGNSNLIINKLDHWDSNPNAWDSAES